MSVAKDLWLELYELRVSELMDAGVPEPQAEAQAERYAERELPERLADRMDAAMAGRKDALHPMFRDHNCAFCGSGTTPCREGNPSRCGNPIARNE